jgi:rhodanese-related sulfurtransferase
MSTSADDLVERARGRIHRVEPCELPGVMAEGGLVIDIRPAAQRREEGSLPGAIVVERNVLEWRLDPKGTHRLADVDGLAQSVVIVCSAGYASSLAAASLAELGYTRASDLIGGYLAWRSWIEHPAAAEPQESSS